MIEIMSGVSGNDYKTERFCSLADRNIVLFVETQSDGSEKKTCYNINKCDKRNFCRYLTKSAGAQIESRAQ
ncbi:MAG: hypothetical protein FWH10_02610 [Oscillospiraceae bacterium]|nr:hypothetical protein [Oscillospiraceae bacterium]